MALSKNTFINDLKTLKQKTRELKRKIRALEGQYVSTKLRKEAEDISNYWIDNCRSRLEFDIRLNPAILSNYSESFRKLYQLAIKNRDRRYFLTLLTDILRKFDDEVILAVHQTTSQINGGKANSIFALPRSAFTEPLEIDYVEEIEKCLQNNCYRAAIALGWSLAIYRIRRKIIDLGYDEFNRLVSLISSGTQRRFKNFNWNLNISTESELQTVIPDKQLMLIIESFDWIDNNQRKRLDIDYNWRCDAAHPTKAVLEIDHIKPFFNDIFNIVIQNPNFRL